MNAEQSASYYTDYFRALRDRKARELFDRVDARLLRQAIKKQTDNTRKAQLELIQANWTALQAWVFGVNVLDEREHQRKRIVGMIPLREDVLQMLLDTGWSWGGNWQAEKDYMHFEDTEALQQVKRNKSR